MAGYGSIGEIVRGAYARWIRPHIAREIDRQRIKLVWDIWGYLPLLFAGPPALRQRLHLVRRFLRIDWHVVHGHKPCEMSALVHFLASRPARQGELVVEAGCWKGGSSAKFSILCEALGFHLWIFDSFEGVEAMTAEELAVGGYDFSGEYAAAEEIVTRHIAQYGEAAVCTTVKGWFCDTLAVTTPPGPIRMAYIDCDLAKGTGEALAGVVPSLAEDGRIFTQDYHLPAVRKLLADEQTWSRLGASAPTITPLCHNLASIRLSPRPAVCRATPSG